MTPPSEPGSNLRTHHAVATKYWRRVIQRDEKDSKSFLHSIISPFHGIARDGRHSASLPFLFRAWRSCLKRVPDFLLKSNSASSIPICWHSCQSAFMMDDRESPSTPATARESPPPFSPDRRPARSGVRHARLSPAQYAQWDWLSHDCGRRPAPAQKVAPLCRP